jgi:hypothetical protein
VVALDQLAEGRLVACPQRGDNLLLLPDFLHRSSVTKRANARQCDSDFDKEIV